MDKKGQGATEYLIILAIVIIIALIVVGAMGGIPGIGTGAKSRASKSFWQTSDVAIPNYAVTASNDAFIADVRNNLRNTIVLGTMTVNGQTMTCSQSSLAAGQETNCTAASVTSCDAGDSYSFAVSLGYSDNSTGAAYTYTGEGHKLDGKCAS